MAIMGILLSCETNKKGRRYAGTSHFWKRSSNRLVQARLRRQTPLGKDMQKGRWKS